ncbi:uncharacterized protein ACJ7VT_020266 [Polymixia lowei]
MATITARRKHNTCLLRIREHCPFRKLRRNRYDVSAASSVWGDLRETSIPPANNQPISTIYSEPPPVPTYQNIYIPHQSQGAVAVQMDLDSAPCSSMLSNLQPGTQQQHRAPTAPREASMELDSEVDPETGERAQG